MCSALRVGVTPREQFLLTVTYVFVQVNAITGELFTSQAFEKSNKVRNVRFETLKKFYVSCSRAKIMTLLHRLFRRNMTKRPRAKT